MAHNNTILHQLLKMFPRHEFEVLAKEHHIGRKSRSMTRWTQYVCLMVAQLSGRCSLRDIVSNILVQDASRYHLGIAKPSRSSLARINEKQPWELYSALFNKLLAKCQTIPGSHGFRFKNKLYSLDATTIDVCLALFPWANFRQAKGAVKLHVGLDHEGMIPSFVQVSDGKTHEINIARTLDLPKASIVVADRAYTDYAWFSALFKKGVYFVVRQKCNAVYSVIKNHENNLDKGIQLDQTINLTGARKKECPHKLRRIVYRDPETSKEYVYITNHFKLSALTIAGIYKSRWQIELFFKWIKQNLKIKTFVGTSKNAVLSQIWIAMCVYLFLAYLKFSSKVGLSMQRMMNLMQLNLFAKRNLIELLVGEPPDPDDKPDQLRLAGY